VIDIIPVKEMPQVAAARAERNVWLAERGYKLIEIPAADIESNLAGVLARIDSALGT
jgi:tRNA/rRNA methyltransferase